MPVAFLSGATGLIGGELCALLAAQGWGVVALARSETPFLANDGTLIAADVYSGNAPGAGQVLRVRGDIGQPRCGLDKATVARLGEQIGCVIHCAASTAFNAADEEYRRSNVAGTAHMLEIATNRPFLHVSTAYVCGTRDGPIAETASAEDAVFANGYERSKADAEALVANSRRPWLIARPSVVVGAATDGHIRRFDSIYGAFKLLAEGRIKVAPARPGASFNLVPVDFVATALAALAADTSNFSGEYVHLCARQALPVTEFVDAIGAYPGLCVAKLVAPGDFDVDSLSRAERMLIERVLSHYLPYFLRCPDFETGNAERLTGLHCPVVDRDIVHILIGYAIRAGFVRPPAIATERD